MIVVGGWVWEENLEFLDEVVRRFQGLACEPPLGKGRIGVAGDVFSVDLLLKKGWKRIFIRSGLLEMRGERRVTLENEKER